MFAKFRGTAVKISCSTDSGLSYHYNLVVKYKSFIGEKAAKTSRDQKRSANNTVVWQSEHVVAEVTAEK